MRTLGGWRPTRSALGVAVVAIDLVLARLLVGGDGRRRRMVRAVSRWTETVPPLVVGVGALMVPVVLQLGADGLRAAGSRESVAKGLQAMADGLDPFRTPGMLLALGVAAMRLPLVVRAVEANRDASRRAMIDAAITLGATPSRARRLASGGRLGASRGALVLSAALAATSLTPALVLAPIVRESHGGAGRADPGRRARRGPPSRRRLGLLRPGYQCGGLRDGRPIAPQAHRRVVPRRPVSRTGIGVATHRPDMVAIKRKGTSGSPEAVAESIEAAKAAGLRYVSDARPGIRRQRRGQGLPLSRPRGQGDPRPRHAAADRLAGDPPGVDRRLDLADRRTGTSRRPAETPGGGSSTATIPAGGRCATRPSTTG